MSLLVSNLVKRTILKISKISHAIDLSVSNLVKRTILKIKKRVSNDKALSVT